MSSILSVDALDGVDDHTLRGLLAKVVTEAHETHERPSGLRLNGVPLPACPRWQDCTREPCVTVAYEMRGASGR